MIRTLLRLLAMIALAIAVIMAVLDATRSIAAETLVMTPLASSWGALAPSSLAGFETMVRTNLPGFFWDPVAVGLIALPGFIFFAGLALVLSIVSHRPVRRERFVLGR